MTMTISFQAACVVLAVAEIGQIKLFSSVATQITGLQTRMVILAADIHQAHHGVNCMMMTISFQATCVVLVVAEIGQIKNKVKIKVKNRVKNKVKIKLFSNVSTQTMGLETLPVIHAVCTMQAHHGVTDMMTTILFQEACVALAVVEILPVFHHCSKWIQDSMLQLGCLV